MKAAELRAVTMRLDVLRDIMVELVAALPPDRAAGFAAALGNRVGEVGQGLKIMTHYLPPAPQARRMAMPCAAMCCLAWRTVYSP